MNGTGILGYHDLQACFKLGINGTPLLGPSQRWKYQRCGSDAMESRLGLGPLPLHLVSGFKIAQPGRGHNGDSETLATSSCISRFQVGLPFDFHGTV
jgi:hypothetical protein